MRLPVIVSIVAGILFFLFTAGCTGIPHDQTAPSPEEQTSSVHFPLSESTATTFILHAAGVSRDGTLPPDYTCSAGMPESPPVSWENVPDGTKTLALIVDDPDAPSGRFTHWIVYNIPADRASIPEGVGAAKEIDGGGQQGTNSADQRGYYPACPQIGSRHRYVFTLYAIDYTMGLPIADRDVIDSMLVGHTIEKTVVTTYYQR